MNRAILTITIFLLLQIVGCKKSSTDGGSSTGKATVTFTNPLPVGSTPFRVILTSSADTLAPYPNLVLDISVPAGASVIKTDIPVGKRKLIGIRSFPGQCDVGQPPTNPIICTTYVNKNVEYLANQNYTTIIQQ